MIEGINKLLELNDIMVRCYTTWYKLEEISITDEGKMPIVVSNDDGEEFSHFDMADIEEFDPSFNFEMDTNIIGVSQSMEYLGKLMKDIEEMNRMAQVYHKNEQWALMDKMLSKINVWSKMIRTILEKEEYELSE